LTTMFSVMLPRNPPPESFVAATQCFQDEPTCSSLDRAQPGGWCQFLSWLDTLVAPEAQL
jgi:hypothetical protein